MNFLVIGNGGREHAIIWKLAQSQKVEKIYCTLGNAGISNLAEVININVDDFNSLLKFAIENKIDYTFVGPEVPLALGIVDVFNAKGLKIFGPSKKGALLEASKSFAKKFMQKYNIPTAQYHTFTDFNLAKNFFETSWPKSKKVVVKADGLAAGKGVIMCQNRQEALLAIEEIMQNKSFGTAGNTIICEEWLEGQEVSILVFVDGKHFSIMPAAQDHKRVGDKDTGLNTGGMGAYAPTPIATKELLNKVKNEIVPNIINGLQNENIDYKGVLYIGFMIDDKGTPYVLEFNCRFGDPETQVILPLLETDLVDIVEHVISGTLDNLNIKWYKKSAVCVVLTSGGYPQKYEKNIKIFGLNNIKENEAIVFHAGTKIDEAGNILTSGGRVIVLTSIADNIKSAIDKVYSVTQKINFDKMHYRKDIAQKALKWIKK